LLLYYITDRQQLPGDERARRVRLLDKIAEAARAGVDYVQLRERDRGARELECLARDAVALVHEANAASSQHATIGRAGGPKPDLQPGIAKTSTRLLINSRADIALAAGADGVHLRSDDLSPDEVRVLWHRARAVSHADANRQPVLAVSCHTVDEVRKAEAYGADFAVFAPVFEKTTAPIRSGVGIEALREACQAVNFPTNVEGVGGGRMPVLALGGVTMENAAECLQAGAAGIAAIRLFQDSDILETVLELRALNPIG
jgi:thiamine-phosphate pyrophosphorylase